MQYFAVQATTGPRDGRGGGWSASPLRFSAGIAAPATMDQDTIRTPMLPPWPRRRRRSAAFRTTPRPVATSPIDTDDADS